jgi:hypothetical protein
MCAAATSDPGRPARLETLGPADCLLLAASAPAGRVAFVDEDPDDGPVVVPVNHRVDGRDIVFRTRSGAILAAVDRGPLTFQTDHVDAFHRSGWSVLARGHAHRIGLHEVEDLALVTWLGDVADHAVRLVPSVVTGRRLRPAEPPHDDRGYL